MAVFFKFDVERLPQKNNLSLKSKQIWKFLVYLLLFNEKQNQKKKIISWNLTFVINFKCLEISDGYPGILWMKLNFPSIHANTQIQVLPRNFEQLHSRFFIFTEIVNDCDSRILLTIYLNLILRVYKEKHWKWEDEIGKQKSWCPWGGDVFAQLFI